MIFQSIHSLNSVKSLCRPVQVLVNCTIFMGAQLPIMAKTVMNTKILTFG